MSVTTFLASKGFLIGAAGVVAVGAIGFGVIQAMGDDDPSAAPSPGDTSTTTASAAPTPKPTPKKTVVATPTQTKAPTAPVTAPPTVSPPAPIKKLSISSFTVTPKDMYEIWAPSPNTKCHSTDNAGSPTDYTYAKVKATTTGSGITSAKVTFSFTGHSGGGDMDKDDSTHWSQTVGGWELDPGDYYTYSTHTVTWVLTVKDRQGNTVAKSTTNTLHGCHASKD
ncbi:MAG: hypothetical protein ABIN55_06450 [Aeromicrobium sp.]